MAGSLQFGPFELDVAAYDLWRAGQRVHLERIPMDVLVLLAERAGMLVDRDQIQAALWSPDVFVDRDAAINTAIRKIRRALGDDVAHPRFVETVVGKGYRFVAQVTRHGPQTSEAMTAYCVTRGPDAFALGAGENLIGRDPAVRVRLDHPSVSRRHARISITGTRVTIEDLNSRNGTFVDGHRIQSSTEIRDGAIIGVGPIALRFAASIGVSTMPFPDER